MSNSKNLISLMYHSIGDTVPEEREVGAEMYDVQVDNFVAQMRWLKDNDYQTLIDLSTLKSSDKAIALTFDDGELNSIEQAFPILTKMGFKAFFFVIVKRVGRPGYMTWDNLKELHQAGMVIGSHGLTHEILTNLKETQIEQELIVSKQTLERNLDIEVTSLSIPRGFFNEKVKALAFESGYKNVFISEAAEALARDCHPRLTVKGHWSIRRFVQAVEGNIPLGEKTFNGIKKTMKFLFRDTGYNFLRTIFLKGLK